MDSWSVCRTFSHATSTALHNGLSKLKNIPWTKTNVAKAGVISTVAAAAVYGIYRLTNYLFGRPARHKVRTAGVPVPPPLPVVAPAGIPATAAANQPGQAQPPVANTVQAANPGNQQNPHANEPQQATIAAIGTNQAQVLPQAQPSAAHPQQVPVAATGTNQAALPQTQQEPSSPAATANVTSPVTPAPVAAPVPPVVLPAFAAATEEDLAVVPYFADPAHHVIEPIEFINPDNHATVTVQQLRALNQFEIDQFGRQVGGGAASCGYQAGPKNTPALTGLIQGINTATLLTSRQAAHDLFNPDPENPGRLRSIINNNRIKTALKHYYTNRLRAREPEPFYAGENTRVIQAIYQTLVNEFIDNAISEELDLRSNHEITLEDIIQALQQMPLNTEDRTLAPREALADFHCTEDELTELLREEQTIRRYLEFRGPLRISQDDIPRAWQQYNRTNVAGAFAQNGEMLNSEDIEHLLEFQRKEDDATSQALDRDAVAVSVLEETNQQDRNRSR